MAYASNSIVSSRIFGPDCGTMICDFISIS